MYAIIVTGGKQYKVEKGDEIFVEKLDAEEGKKVKLNAIAKGEDGKLTFGETTVDAKVIKNGKSKKVTVFTYKPKKSEKRKMGHRQPYTKVSIESI